MKEKYRLTVFSDSHGSSGALRESIELHRRDTDCFIFLGNGCREAVPLLEDCGKAYQVVPGNCDMFVGGMPESLTLDLGAARIFICHGHRYGVKGTLSARRHASAGRILRSSVTRTSDSSDICRRSVTASALCGFSIPAASPALARADRATG